MIKPSICRKRVSKCGSPIHNNQHLTLIPLLLLLFMKQYTMNSCHSKFEHIELIKKHSFERILVYIFQPLNPITNVAVSQKSSISKNFTANAALSFGSFHISIESSMHICMYTSYHFEFWLFLMVAILN